MKLYATIESREGKLDGVGSNKQLRIGIGAKNKQRCVVLVDYLPKEASRDNKESVVIQFWGDKGELCDREIIKM